MRIFYKLPQYSGIPFSQNANIRVSLCCVLDKLAELVYSPMSRTCQVRNVALSPAPPPVLRRIGGPGAGTLWLSGILKCLLIHK